MKRLKGTGWLVSRYIDIFVRSEESPEQFAAQLEQLLSRRLERVTDRGDEVLYLYSGSYKWFDVCAGMLDRHPDYNYQLYVGRGHHDVGDRLRVNFAWSIVEKLSLCYPLILEDSLSRLSISLNIGESPPSGLLDQMVKAGAGEVATIFADSDETPMAFAQSLESLLHMESHKSTRAHSPVIAVMVGEAVRFRVETHDYEDTAGLAVRAYRYCIDLDPLDAENVYQRLMASGRYPLLWVRNLAETAAVYEP